MPRTYPNSSTHDARLSRPVAPPKTAAPNRRPATKLTVTQREYANLQCGAGEIRGVVVDASDRLEHWPVLWDVLGTLGQHVGLKVGHISGSTLVTEPLFRLLCILALEHVKVDE